MVSAPALAAQKAKGPTEKLCRLPGELIFSISYQLSHSVSDPAHRETLFKRLRNYAYTPRRGRLRLPAYLPAKVRGLSKLTKRQVREILYWVRPSTGMKMPLSERQLQFVRQHSTVPIWNRWSAADHHMAHKVGVPRLRKSEVPSKGRALWPSAPSFTEMLEMGRRGVLQPPAQKYGPRFTVPNCLTRKSLSDNIRLATKIVAKMVIGIRSSVEVREAWLPWFRYRHGFLILSVRYNIPAGLVRFLLSNWKTCPTNLWLVEHCPLRIFLRRHTAVDFGVYQIDTVVSGSDVSSQTEGSGVGSPPTFALPLMQEDEMVAELGEEFRNFLSGLPG